MPNWCSNYLQIRGNEEDINKFKEENKPTNESGALSFNNSVPLPETEKDNWYMWCIEYWGTKWDVNTDSELLDGDQDTVLDYSFDTAWAPPVAWLKAVYKKYPTLMFHMAWVEDAMCFSGEVFASAEDDQYELLEFPDRNSEDYRRIYELVFGTTDGLDPEDDPILLQERKPSVVAAKPAENPKPEQPDALFLVLSDGETYSGTEGSAVLVIDGKYYATDECAEIEEASDLPVDVIKQRIPVDELLQCYANFEAAKQNPLTTLSESDDKINLEALSALFEVADGEECAMLDSLAVKAGLMWKCPCGATTYGDTDQCFGCDAKRGETSEDSKVPSSKPEGDPQ